MQLRGSSGGSRDTPTRTARWKHSEKRYFCRLKGTEGPDDTPEPLFRSVLVRESWSDRTVTDFLRVGGGSTKGDKTPPDYNGTVQKLEPLFHTGPDFRSQRLGDS